MTATKFWNPPPLPGDDDRPDIGPAIIQRHPVPPPPPPPNRGTSIWLGLPWGKRYREWKASNSD